MSRTFTSNTSNYCYVGNSSSTPVLGALVNGASACTVHCFAFPNVLLTGQFLLTIWTGAALNGISIFSGTNGTLRFIGRSAAADTSQSAFSTQPLYPGLWWPCGGIWDFANKRISAFVNGMLDGAVSAAAWSSTTYNGSTTTATADQIGNSATLLPPSSTTNQFPGLIAEFAIWKVALNNSEMLQLSRGVSPLLIRRPSLIFYSPLAGRASPEPDFSSNANNVTINGTLLEGPPPDIFNDPIIINGSALLSAAPPPPSVLFRREASRIGTRIGTRQTWNVT